MWIIAGPNGAGKSTFTRYGVIREASGLDLIELNADERTKAILTADPTTPDANLQAAIETDAAVADCIEHGVDLLVETVLSSDKYLDDVARAQSLGYRIGLVYVALATPADAIRRVALRRAQGGHDVPADRVEARWRRSLAMLARFSPLVDRLYVFDNTAPASAGDPILIAYKEDDGRVVLVTPDRIPQVDAALRAGSG